MHESMCRPIVTVLVLLLAACTTAVPPEHESQADPGADIAAWSRFGWQRGAAGDDEPTRLLDTHIRTAILAELTRRGYVQADADPQFLVSYETAAQDKVKSSPLQIGIGMGSWGGSGGGSVNVGSPSVRSYREGRLVIHVIDAASNQEVWYGTIRGRIDNQTLDAPAIARVVALAMEDFPARTGAGTASP